MQLEIILNVITALFGGAGVFSFLAARKERQAQAKITEAGALEAMQKVYQQMILDTNMRIKEMQSEIDLLRSKLESQMKKCNNCKNS